MSRIADYNAYLDSNHWKQLRRRKFEQVGRACQCCGAKSPLHVHHIRYKNLTDCDISDLAVLCEPCHDVFHSALKVTLKATHDYDNVGSIVGLVNWFRGTDAGIQYSTLRKSRKKNKLQRKREKKDFRHTFNQIVDGCRRNGYKVEAVRECIASLQALIGEQEACDVTSLLLNHSADETRNPF